MAEHFDPYLQWLGIRDPQRPPNYYRLLGVEPYESDPVVITHAADRQMAHVRKFQAGKHSAASQQVLNELAAAKLCLLNPERKAQYDVQLQAQQAAAIQTPSLTPATGATGQAAPAGLWPLGGQAVPAAQPGQPLAAPADSDAPEGEAAPPIPWFSIAATALVAMILVLVGLIVVISARNRERGEGPYATKPEEEVTPKPAEKPQPGPGTKPPPEEKPKTKPETTQEPKPKPKPETKPDTKPGPLPPAPESIRAVRAALAARDVEAARRHVELARQAAAPLSDEAREAACLAALGASLDAFWKAAAAALQEVKPGERVAAAGAQGDVTSVSADGLVVNVAGQERQFTLKNMPGDLALALARRKLPAGAGGLVPRAAMLVFDPAGDLAEADRLCQDAIAQGAPAAAELAEELKLAQAARGTVKVEPKPGPEPKSDRLPVPDEAAQQKVLAEVKEVFAKEYAAAAKPEERGKLAATLFKQGTDTRDNPTARYVLLVEARGAALDAGDRDLVDRAMRAIARYFEVDLVDMAAEVFAEAARRGRSAAANKTMAQAALDMAKTASTQDRPEQATALAEAAIAMARKGGDMGAVKKAVAARRQFDDLKQRYQAFVAAGKALEQDPDDPQASLQRGAYLCFVKDDWPAGLALLAKGSDPVLKALAEAETAAPRQPADRVALADKWWDAAEAAPDENTKDRYRARAGHWYEQALPGVTGLTKTKVQRRLDEIRQ